MTNPTDLQYALHFPFDGMVIEATDLYEAQADLEEQLNSQALMEDIGDEEEAEKYRGVRIVARPKYDPYAEWIEVED